MKEKTQATKSLWSKTQSDEMNIPRSVEVADTKRKSCAKAGPELLNYALEFLLKTTSTSQTIPLLYS